MIKNKKLFEKFEREQIKKNKPDFFKNLKIFEALYTEARRRGALPPKDPLEGIEVDFKIARIINKLR